MVYVNKIIKKIELDEFNKKISRYSKEDIICTRHTFFHFSQKQREIYTEEEIIKIIRKEKPFLVGIQENENYSVFYRYKNKIYRIILGIDSRKINIVTFYFIDERQVPKI